MGLSSFLFSYRARSQMKDIIYSKSSSLERKEELPAWEEAIFFFFLGTPCPCHDTMCNLNLFHQDTGAIQLFSYKVIEQLYYLYNQGYSGISRRRERKFNYESFMWISMFTAR